MRERYLGHVEYCAWGLETPIFGVHWKGPCMCKLCEYARREEWRK